MNVWINKFIGDALHRKLNSLTVITVLKCHYYSWIVDFQYLKNSENFLNLGPKQLKYSVFLSSIQSLIFKQLGIQRSTETE